VIHFKEIEHSDPYIIFKKLYDQALQANEAYIEAFNISSLNKATMEIDARFVNLKYVKNNEWTFFTNYNSPKAIQFKSFEHIAAVFFWKKTNIQIRIKASIRKTDSNFSDYHFLNRSLDKNALAISSDQSCEIESFELVKNKYNETLKSLPKKLKRPNYWGGFTFTPYYFEFWEGGKSRLNQRSIYQMNDDKWIHKHLQP
jgi:pyridoxamine 5'-phosphate oxidase